MFNNESMKYDIQKLIEERNQPLKDLQAGFEEIRKAEEEARAKAEAEEKAKQPPKALTTDQQIEFLTKVVAELTIKLDAKGGK